MRVVTVGKSKNTDDEKEEDEAAETAPEIVLQTCVTPSKHDNTTFVIYCCDINTHFYVMHPGCTGLIRLERLAG